MFVKETYKDVDAEEYFNEMKKYALKLFMNHCEEEVSDVEKNSEDFTLENHKKEVEEYFNYIYDNLKYSE